MSSKAKSTTLALTPEAAENLTKLKKMFKLNQPVIINRLIETATEKQIQTICSREIAEKAANDKERQTELAQRLAGVDPDKVEELMKQLGV